MLHDNVLLNRRQRKILRGIFESAPRMMKAVKPVRRMPDHASRKENSRAEARRAQGSSYARGYAAAPQSTRSHMRLQTNG